MTTSTYAIVHIPDNTPELPMTALGAHVTIRTHAPGYIASLINCPDCGTMHPPDDCDLVPCTGGCGEMVPDAHELGDPYCEDCSTATIPEDARAMKAAPPDLVRDIAALPESAYFTFWERLLHEYLADPPVTDLDIDALQDAINDFAQDRSPNTSTPQSLAPAGPAAHPTRLAG